MSDLTAETSADAARDWWTTSIIDMAPGEIRFAGYPIEQLIGRVGYAQMVWLMTRGELPTPAQARLLEAALVAGVDHGPQAPSCAMARMAMTCGVGINSAVASALNVLGDVHGGAGEQAMALYAAIARRIEIDGQAHEVAAEAEIDALKAAGQRYVPGFGHRFHPIDPRAPRLMALVEQAAKDGTVTGDVRAIALAVEAVLEHRAGKPIPMNIDGATAVIFAELGFEPRLGRGLFLLSRAVGLMAHAAEQARQGGRNKGPLPPQFLFSYDGPPPRDVPEGGEG
jgi:citrate synthase